MKEYIDIGEQRITLSWDRHEQCLAIISPRFIQEPDATLFLPKGQRNLSSEAPLYLRHFISAYKDLKANSFTAIGQKAFEGRYWGKRLSEQPQMHLVWTRFTFENHPESQPLELAFNDAEHDPYTLWVTRFQGLELNSVERRTW